MPNHELLDSSTTTEISKNPYATTPLMQQYLEIKSRYPDCLLFFRMGDFYELFFEDAKTASKILEIALTARNKTTENPVPMCGVPHHSASPYIYRLVSQNYKVAICEQLEEATAGKGIVKRDVIRVITPGTRFEAESLDSKSNNFTHAVFKPNPHQKKIVWATIDFSTGSSFFGEHETVSEWLQFVSTHSIVEILVPQNSFGDEIFTQTRNLRPQVATEILPEFYFGTAYAKERVLEQFKTKTLSSIHPEVESSVEPLGALIKYFQETQKTEFIPTLYQTTPWNIGKTMHLDSATVRALDLIPDRNSSGGKNLSLLSHLDRTATAMGGRLLKQWILEPRLDLAEINRRLDGVEFFSKNLKVCVEISKSLSEIYDFERLLSRLSIAKGRIASPRDLSAMVSSIGHSVQLGFLKNYPVLEVRANSLFSTLENLFEYARYLAPNLTSPAPLLSREGGIFQKGFNAELDELIELCANGESWLARYEMSERERTKISSLKVRFNRVFGYYIEVTKSNLSNVPSHYIRKQTTAGGERYLTEELKTFEEKVLHSEKRREELELQLFREHCEKISSFSKEILDLSTWIAEIDVLLSFSKVCDEYEYIRPTLHDGEEISIIEAKHPTLSVLLERNPPYTSFVPNDFNFDPSKNFILITGPNMGGKSTAMRTVAVLTLMAQMGCFIPAKSANIGIVDQIYTRIGAHDDASQGESTFMVEMSEMSYILRHASQRSLILIDEIGRGTSTYDGISLAWALAFEIANRLKARTLFSTHYHELTKLSLLCSNVENKRVGVEFQADGKIRFLYRLEHGSTDRSYGVQVARLAGLPSTVIENAERVLNDLEKKKVNMAKKSLSSLPNNDDFQLDFLK